MRFDYTQVFLLAWFVAFWSYHFSTYGRVEGKYERSVQRKYGFRAKWARFFGLAFFGWTGLIIIYFFNYSSINWIWKISLLDRTPVKIVAIGLLSAAFLLYILFTATVGKSIRTAASTGGKPKLITTGIYRFTRHPAYLSFLAVALGVFLIVPNLIALVLLLYTWIVTSGHSVEEEKKLMKVYGQEYETYRRKVGRFLPKLW